jgi:hypothetical protein
MNTPTDRCAHLHCSCPAQWDTGFCSDYCRTAEAAHDHDCLCGHAECSKRYEAAIEESVQLEN